MKKSLISLLIFMSFVAQSQSLLSFPEAEGFGRFAQGARGYPAPSVYFVTNLDDSGAGSFRDAVSQPGRFVIFRIAGIIRLLNSINVAPNTTIAGHTAPGCGVVLYGRKVSFSGASNTIARYLRIRLGADAGAGKNEDASGISNGRNIMLDHMSFSWGLDEVFSINWDKKGQEPDSITLQNCIISQGLHLHNHSAGGLMQTDGRFSILHSLYISNKTRNPKVKGDSEFVNNVVYNFGNYGTAFFPVPKISAAAYILGGGSGKVSNAIILNNYFIGGPLTPPDVSSPFSRGNENFNLYAGGNYFDNNQNGMLDGTQILNDTIWFPGLGVRNFKQKEFFADYPSLSPKLSADAAFESVVGNVGANLPCRDEVDIILIDELLSKGKNGKAIFKEDALPLQNGGLGNYKNAKPLTDSDNDGIPDVWERRLKLDVHNPKDALAFSKNPAYKGYLNIEVYLNQLADLNRR